jgi:hypothetical protein
VHLVEKRGKHGFPSPIFKAFALMDDLSEPDYTPARAVCQKQLTLF